MATKCRVSPPNSIQMVTRRTTQRQFLLRPDPPLVQAFYYILGYLQTRFAIEYHAVSILSTHLHLLLTDVLGDQIQSFNRELFSLLSRVTNCYWGRSENLWSSDKPNCVLVAPRADDVVDKSSYTAVNFVEAGLVSHAKKWPGVRVLASEMGRLRMRIKRPKFFFDPKGQLPEEVEVSFTLPRVWDAEPDELRRRIEQECNRREREIREQFENEGRRFMGAKRVRRQSIRSTPRTREPRFGLVPHVACKDVALRTKYLNWRKERQKRYEERRKALLDGQKRVVFPEGTYVLHFRVGQQREPWKG